MSLAAADNGDGLETGLAFGDVETFMLMRALFALVLVCCTAVASLAQETKVVALGITDHVVIREELQEGGELLKPKFNTPGVAYALIAHARKGDTIQVTLNKNGKPLMTNTRDLEADEAGLLLQAGKSGVPAGGWPEGSYTATLQITRDGRPVLTKESEPMTFE